MKWIVITPMKKAYAGDYESSKVKGVNRDIERTYQKGIESKMEPQFTRMNLKQGTCYHCNETGHWKRYCPKLKDKAIKRNPRAWMASTKKITKCYCGDKDCVPRALDSGATRHIDNRRSYFKEIRKSKKCSIEIANGEVIEATEEGIFEAELINNKGENEKIEMKDTLLVEELSMGLISVSRLTEKGMKITFQKTHATILDSEGSLVYKAEKVNGIYLIHMKERKTKESANLVRGVGEVSSGELWHWRVGHPNTDTLNKMIKG